MWGSDRQALVWSCGLWLALASACAPADEAVELAATQGEPDIAALRSGLGCGEAGDTTSLSEACDILIAYAAGTGFESSPRGLMEVWLGRRAALDGKEPTYLFINHRLSTVVERTAHGADRMLSFRELAADTEAESTAIAELYEALARGEPGIGNPIGRFLRFTEVPEVFLRPAVTTEAGSLRLVPPSRRRKCEGSCSWQIEAHLRGYGDQLLMIESDHRFDRTHLIRFYRLP